MSANHMRQERANDPEMGLNLPKYLHCREGVFYFKRKVPARLCNFVNPPKEQVWKSLHTTDFSEAVQLRNVENEIFETAMNDAKFELSGHVSGCVGRRKYGGVPHWRRQMARAPKGPVTSEWVSG